MQKRLIFLLIIVFKSAFAFSQQIPSRSNTLVTDYTQTLSPAEVQKLETKLLAFNDSTSTQIAVVLIKTTGQYDIKQYGLELARNWGIGQKGKNNGILILAAIDDRKVTIQTGYGAEAAVPDVTANQIIQNEIVPHFKQKEYYAGLDAATDYLMVLMRGEYKPSSEIGNNQSNYWGVIIALIIIVLIILIIVYSRRRSKNSQIISNRGSASPFWWFLGGTFIGSGSYWSNRSDDDNSDSDSGGDFDSFGGGDFGGGGSDGSW